MAKREYKVRLYGLHDADLINLARNYDIKFSTLVKESLICYVNKKEILFDLPEPFADVEPELNKMNIKFNLDDTNSEEIKVINLLDSIKTRYQNTVIKNIVRNYVKIPVTSFFIEDPKMGALIDSYNEDSRREEGYCPGLKKTKAHKNIKTLEKNHKIEDNKKESDSKEENKPITRKKETILKPVINKENGNSVPTPENEKPVSKEEISGNSVPTSENEEQEDSSLLNMFEGLFKGA